MIMTSLILVFIDKKKKENYRLKIAKIEEKKKEKHSNTIVTTIYTAQIDV